MKPKRATIRNRYGSRLTVEVWENDVRLVLASSKWGVRPFTFPHRKVRSLAKWVLKNVPE